MNNNNGQNITVENITDEMLHTRSIMLFLFKKAKSGIL